MYLKDIPDTYYRISRAHLGNLRDNLFMGIMRAGAYPSPPSSICAPDIIYIATKLYERYERYEN